MVIQNQANVETYRARQGSMLAKRIHETILALDSELIIAVDIQYREQLVRAAYSLRNLEELIRREPYRF
jgi:hypothetical protein